jgi:hypothetical protein
MIQTEDVEKILAEKRKQQPDIGVTTITLNRLPIFQPTLRAKYQKKAFESPYGRLTVEGRLGQNHKSLLEVILYLRKLYDLDEENMKLRVLYNEYEVKKYLTTGSTTYSYEGYKQLMEDMKQAYIELGTIPPEPIIKGITPSNNYWRKTKGNLPAVKGKELPYMIVEFGSVISYLVIKELRFTYDPKPILQLHGISQAVARYLKTHKNHPSAGYHLRTLIETLTGNIEGQEWYNIKRLLKKDVEGLKKLGIAIDFKKNRLFMIENYNVKAS